MSVVCNGPGGERHEINDGARKITIPALTVEWGAEDIRDDWTGPYVFCSFGCLEEWATEKAVDHDGRVVKDGKTPGGDES